MSKMHAEPKRLLVEALRSGEYEQTRGSLAIKIEEDKFHCCLGVASEVCPAAKQVERAAGAIFFGPVDKDFDKDKMEFDQNYLPRVVQDWLGVEENNPTLPFFNRDGQLIYLAALNDEGFTFDQISDLIEYCM